MKTSLVLSFLLCSTATRLVAQAAPESPETGTATERTDEAPEGPSETRAERRASGRTKPAHEQALDPADLERLLARYAHEPTVSDVVAAALDAQRATPERFAGMASRARQRGFVPSLDLGARRLSGVDLRTTSSDDTDVRLTTDDNLVLQATLRFDLGRLVFASEEVGIAREARTERAARTELVRDVVRLYFLRRRLLLERDARGKSDVEHEMRIAEAEALLDGFTSGAFRRMMAARRPPWTTGANTPASP